MDPLASSNPARRRYAALLMDIDGVGGAVSEEDLALRAALYGLGQGHLGALIMSAVPPLVTREPSGWWGLTAAGRYAIDQIHGGSMRDLARAASPWAE